MEVVVLSFDTVHALTDCLLQTDQDTPPDGADRLGHLLLAQDRPFGPNRWDIREARILRLPLTCGTASHPTLPAALDHLADTLTAEHTPPHGPLHEHDLQRLRDTLAEPLPALRLIAWAVLYDDIAIHADHLTPVRRVDAVDVDGRVYQLHRRHTEQRPVVLIDEHPGSPLTATQPALARLVTAASGASRS
ncbi:MAG: hypothetical protein WCA46_09685 [Actinocatenispora sp.]